MFESIYVSTAICVHVCIRAWSHVSHSLVDDSLAVNSRRIRFADFIPGHLSSIRLTLHFIINGVMPAEAATRPKFVNLAGDWSMSSWILKEAGSIILVA
jgi:hypothetical protein